MKTIFLYNTNDQSSLEKLSQQLEFLNDAHKGKQVTYVIEIKKNRPVRSVKANRYYRACLQVIGAKTGVDEDSLHEFFKLKFNSAYVFGELVGLSTKMDTEEFSTYVKKVKHYAREFHGCYFMEKEDPAYAAWERMTRNNYNAMFAAV